MMSGRGQIQSVPFSQPQQKRDGARDGIVSRSPSSDRAGVYLHGASEAALRERQTIKRCAEVLGAHGSDRTKMFFVDAHLAAVGELHDPIAHRPQVALGGADDRVLAPVIEPAALAIGRNAQQTTANSDGLLVLESHFDLQRAWAPFRTITIKADKMSGVKRVFGAAA